MANNFIYLPKRYSFLALLLYSCITFSQSGSILKIDSISQAGVVGKLVTDYSNGTYTNQYQSDYQLGYFAGMQCIGDIDNDGKSDYALASWRDGYTGNRTGGNENGIVYVFFGDSSAKWTNTDMPVEQMADMVLMSSGGWLGWYLATLGDVNGDGIDDFAIAALDETTGGTNRPGCVYLLFGKPNRQAWKLNSDTGVNQSAIPVSSLRNTPAAYKYKWLKPESVSKGTGIADYALHGRPGRHERFGRNVAAAGDVDGDGVGDILIGASEWSDSAATKPRKGKVYVVRGMKTGQAGNTVNWGINKNVVLDTISNTSIPYISYRSTKDFEMLGYGLSDLGDMDMDGIDDIAFGGDNSDNNVPNLPDSFAIDGITYYKNQQNVSSYALSRAYMVFGKTGFFNNWQTLRDSISTANADVTFISGYTIEIVNNKTYRWSHMLGTIIGHCKSFAPNPDYNPNQLLSAQNPRLLNVLMLSEPAYDSDSTLRIQNHGRAILFFARPRNQWNAEYNFKSPGTHSQWKYFSLINYGDVSPTSADSLQPANTGMGLQGLGDVNADGFADMAISSHYDNEKNNPNAITLLYGGAPLQHYLNSANSDSVLLVKNILSRTTHLLYNKLNVVQGKMWVKWIDTTVVPKDTTYSTSLCQTSGPGDINGDNLQDMVFTDYRFNPQNSITYSGAGKAYIHLQQKPGHDLWGKDHVQDNGIEPGPAGSHLFTSPDISNRVNCYWGNQGIRHLGLTTDSLINELFTHQNPDPKNPNLLPADSLNHLFVRLRNRGSQASTAGVYKLCLYWTLGQTGEEWPTLWNGDSTRNFTNCSTSVDDTLPLGGLIGTYSLPAIGGGGFIIVEFPWQPPSPCRYSNWMDTASGSFRLKNVCVLARIVYETSDELPHKPQSGIVTGMSVSEGTSLERNVRANNNTYTRNMYVVDDALNGIAYKRRLGGLLLHNPYNHGISTQLVFDITASTPDNLEALGGRGLSSYQLALPAECYSAWVSAGSMGQNITDLNTTDSLSNHLLRISGRQAKLEGITLSAYAQLPVYIDAELDPEFSADTDFTFCNRINLSLWADVSQSGYPSGYRDEYYSLFGTYYEELGGQQIEFLLH